jgi:hypothetical protein
VAPATQQTDFQAGEVEEVGLIGIPMKVQMPLLLRET